MSIPEWLTEPANYQVRTYDPPLEWKVQIENRLSEGGPASAAVTALQEVLASQGDLRDVEVVSESHERPEAVARFRVHGSRWLDLDERFSALAEDVAARTRSLLDPGSLAGWTVWTGGVSVEPADATSAGPDAYQRA